MARLAVAGGAGSAGCVVTLPPNSSKVVDVEGVIWSWAWLNVLMASSATFVGSGRVCVVNGAEECGSTDELCEERATGVVPSA